MERQLPLSSHKPSSMRAFNTWQRGWIRWISSAESIAPSTPWSPSSRRVERVQGGAGSFGYNAATDSYGDLVAMGVIDPTKVTRLGLQNAASIASLILTTDCIIVEATKPSSPDAGEIPGTY